MSGQQTSTTNQTATQTADPRTQAAVQSVLNTVPGIVNTQYQPGMNVNVAGLNSQQTQAIQGLGGLQSNNPASPFISQANQYSQLAADPSNVTAMASQFYNPMSQQVLNQLGNVFGQQNAQLLGNAASSGAIGGSRYGVAAGNLANQQGLAAGQTLAGLQQQALQAAQTQQGQISQQAFTQGQLGNEALNTQLQGINAALQGGNITQQQAQALYNAATQNSIQQTLWPQQEAAAAGNIAGLGSILGGTSVGQGTTSTPVNYANMIGGIASLGAGLMSDERVKENIEPIGKSFDKQNIYKFNYIGDPTTRIGLMAQEVQKKHPDAVEKGPGGLKAVDYNKALPLHRADGGSTPSLAEDIAQSSKVNVPQVHYPTLDLNPQKQGSSGQQQSGGGLPGMGGLGSLGSSMSGGLSGLADSAGSALGAVGSGIGDAAGAIGSALGGMSAADFLPALAFLADGGSVRKHRAIGGGTGIGLGASGLEGYSGIPSASSSGLNFTGVQSPLSAYFAQSPQVNIPHANFPTLNLGGGGQNGAQQQPFSDPKQMQALGQNLGTMGNAADTYFNADFGGGGADFAHGGRVHRQSGGPVASAFPQSIADAIQKHPDATSIKQGPDGGHQVVLQNGIGIKYPGQKQSPNGDSRIHRDDGGPVEQDVTAQPSISDFINRRLERNYPVTAPPLGANADPSAPAQASIASVNPVPTTMASLSSTPSPGTYYDLNDDGTRKGAPPAIPQPEAQPKPIQDRLQPQQAALTPAQAPAPIAQPQQNWGDIPHTPQLANDRQRFAEELRSNPALRDKYLTISLQEQNDPTGNLAIFETAMNRASVNGTTLAQELRMHNTEGGYYGGPYRPELLNNPRYRQMAEMNLERALSGSNVAKYGTDNSSGDFGRIRNSNGMYTPTAAYNGEYISYPSRSDARGYDGFPEWLNSVGGSIEGGLNQFAGAVKGGIQQAGEGVRGIFNGGNQPQNSVLDRPDLQPPKPGDSYLDRTLASFGMNLNQPQGLGGSLGRAMGLNPSLGDQASNRLVNLGLGMLAQGPTVGIKGPAGGIINTLTGIGKGGQFALQQEQNERQQAIQLANQALNQQLHGVQAAHIQQRMQKEKLPEWKQIGSEEFFNPDNGQHTYRTKFGWVDPWTHKVLTEDEARNLGLPAQGEAAPTAPGATTSQSPAQQAETMRKGYEELDTDPNLKGPAYMDKLRQIDPRRARRVDAILRGDAPLPTSKDMTSRNSVAMRDFDAAERASNGTVSAQTYPTLLAANKDFLVSQSANNIKSGTQAVDHMYNQYKYIPFLNNTSSEWWNRNTSGVSSPINKDYRDAFAGFNTTTNGVASELAKFFKGNGVSAEKEVEEWRNAANVHGPADTQYGHLYAAGKMMLGQAEAAAEKYNAAHRNQHTGEYFPGFKPKEALDFMPQGIRSQFTKMMDGLAWHDPQHRAIYGEPPQPSQEAVEKLVAGMKENPDKYILAFDSHYGAGAAMNVIYGQKNTTSINQNP